MASGAEVNKDADPIAELTVKVQVRVLHTE